MKSAGEMLKDSFCWTGGEVREVAAGDVGDWSGGGILPRETVKHVEDLVMKPWVVWKSENSTSEEY